jgi:hypothetical protein
MVTGVEISQIRNRWVEILDHLERENHIAWLAFFDARLAGVEGNCLTLDFSDSRKFASAHEYNSVRIEHVNALEKAINEVLGIELRVVEQ